MSICFTYHRYSPLLGGVELQLKLLAESLSSFYEIKIVTFKLTESLDTESYGSLEIYRVTPQLILYRVPFSVGLVKTLKKIDFDILHTFGVVPGISDVSIFYAKFIKKEAAVYSHRFDGNVQDSTILNSAANFYNKTIGSLSARFSDVIIATSKSYAETSPTINRHLRKVKVIPCFVDTNLFSPQDESNVNFLRKNLNLNGDKIVLYVGRIVPYKGLYHLIKSFRMIREDESKNLSNKSEYHRKILDYVYRHRLQNYIRFVGKIPNEKLPIFYTLADVLVLPSITRGESFGNVLLEALSCGTPVVASDLPGVNDVLKGNTKIGLYVPPKDYNSLSESIIEVANKKPETTKQCRQFVIENYDKVKLIREYTRLYENLL